MKINVNRYWGFLGLSWLLIGLTAQVFAMSGQAQAPSDLKQETNMAQTDEQIKPKQAAISMKLATFAGGCFWCMEPPFDETKGVLSTTSGYTGGKTPQPDYQQVSKGGTGHAEVIQIEYDASQVSYAQLLEVFWKNIDPTVKDRQFCDTGDQYRSAIFVHDEQQKQQAEASLQALKDTKRFTTIETTIEPMSVFYPAEDYHQNYYQKNPVRYKFYRYSCGRDKRLKALWGE